MDEYYNSISNGYNKLYGDEQKEKLDKIKEKFTVKRTDLLLDIGCGTGISSNWGCRVVSCDPNIQLLSKVSGLKVCCAGEMLPFKDELFDVVISLTAIHNYDDPIRGLQEIKRVCAKRAVISVLRGSKHYDAISNKLEKIFILVDRIDHPKDTIFLLSKI